MGIWEYVQAIIILIAVMAAAYYVTRLIARASGPYRKCPQLKLIGSLPLAKDKSVALVAVGEHAYVLGVGPQRVEQLDKLPLAEFDLIETAPEPPDFAASFQKELRARLKQWKK